VSRVCRHYRILSTPSLGITDFREFPHFRVAVFQLPLSGSPVATNGLSSSRSSMTLSTPSLGITTPSSRLTSATRRPFNSLSRDHVGQAYRAGNVFISFQLPLSGSPAHAARRPSRLHGALRFQLPLSGSLSFSSRVSHISTASRLSTPSLGITRIIG